MTISNETSQRTNGPLVDYGSTWADPDGTANGHWRISWDPQSGDLTTVPVGDDTDARLLGRLPTRADVDRALAGWADACVSGETTSWAANRMSMWFAGLTPAAELEVEHPAQAAPSGERADRLPAEPVVGVLAGYRADFGESDTGMLARGLGLDEQLVDDLFAGRVTTLDVEQIAGVCEGLMASPYDLWHPDEARTILHAYGPERWPRTIFPLDDPEPRSPKVSDEFISRRLDQQVGELLERGIHRLVEREHEARLRLVDEVPSRVEVTAYSITGLLAVDKDGQISEPSPSNIADTNVEYHFQFTEREASPSDVDEPTIKVSSADVAAGPPGGASVHPRLAAAAESLRIERGRRADMVRFRAPDGQEAWVGWDPDEQTWDAWDDPRSHFSGPGEMLFEAAHPEERPSMTSDLRPHL